MDEKEIIKLIVDDVLDSLANNDEFLIFEGVSELSVSHKIATYLGKYFQHEFVDVEYNKIGLSKEPKQLETLNNFLFESDWINYNENLISEFYKLNKDNHDELKKKLRKIYKSEKKIKKVRPDIIVHERGKCNNLLIIELKKKGKSVNNLYDIIKLHFYKIYLDYKYAAFIQYGYDGNDIIFNIHWINDSENESKINFDFEENVYEEIKKKDSKKFENVLNNVLKILEEKIDKIKENPEQIFVRLSEILDKKSPIKHSVFSEAIEELEKEIGKISIYEVADKLPLQNKNERYLFLLNEISALSIGTLKAMRSYQADFFKEKIDELNKENNPNFTILEFLNENTFDLNELQQLLTENINFLQSYCMDFEIVYRNFVFPIYELLKEKDMLPKLEKKEDESYSGLYIKQVKQFFETNTKYIPLIFLLENLNAEIRNAVIHQNYYIKEESNELIYYYLPKLPKGIKEANIKSLKEDYFKLATAKLIWFVSIGKRLDSKSNT
ncbi:MAG: hypothetical protein ACTSXA_05155 [Candidatus Heimdallarchaeota archaeon]